jgi:t-SNARE complex subunit (syntaxin)
MIDDYSSNPDSLATDLPFVLSFGGITLFFLIFNNLSYFFSMRKIKKMQKANSELYDEVNKIDDKIRELENESSKRSGDIRRFIHEFVRKDKLIMRDNKS